ncbi:hypothetical protein [Streptomyces orinoci]|uniref:Secreted protein n=1 Tax=Streptomyces orinoci TaxID=67339 RepID=A0ABV3JZ14_STRON|nr:hypothetical protein [Streptomyces orinoci]
MRGTWRWVRVWGSLVVAVGMVVTGPMAAPALAHEEGAVVSCVGTNTIEFSPGLSLWARRTRIHGTGAYRCVSVGPAVTAAKSEISGGGMNGCFASHASTAEHITWNTGEQSTVVYPMGDVRQVAGQAVVLVAGKVVAGKFRGRTAVSPGAQLTLDIPGCATRRGVPLITGPSTLLIR